MADDRTILKSILKSSAVGCGMRSYGWSIDQGRAIIATVIKFWIQKKKKREISWLLGALPHGHIIDLIIMKLLSL
jgi:hypothetical protein